MSAGPSNERSRKPRYAPCLVLDDKRSPRVFKLYVLGTNINVAADCLVQACWTVDTQPPHKFGKCRGEGSQIPILFQTKGTKSVSFKHQTGGFLCMLTRPSNVFSLLKIYQTASCYFHLCLCYSMGPGRNLVRFPR